MSVIQVNKKYRSWEGNLATAKTAMKVRNDIIGLGVGLRRVPVEGSSERGISCTAERLPASQKGLCSTTLLDCKLSLDELQTRSLKQQNQIRTTAIIKHTLSIHCIWTAPTPSAARSKARVCGYSLAGTAGSNPAGGMDVLSLMSVECCHVEVSASGCSLVQKSSTERGVSECDREVSIMRRPRPTHGCCAMEIWIALHQTFDFKHCRQEASPMHIIWMVAVYFGTANTTVAVMLRQSSVTPQH